MIFEADFLGAEMTKAKKNGYLVHTCTVRITFPVLNSRRIVHVLRLSALVDLSSPFHLLKNVMKSPLN